MAYMPQELKKRIQAKLKLTVPFGWKWSLRVHHHSTLIMTITRGPKTLLDHAPFRGNGGVNEKYDLENYQANVSKPYRDTNVYHLEDGFPKDSPIIGDLRKILDVLNMENFDKSDISTDYFHVGYYVGLKIGDWEKPLQVID